MEVGGVYQSSGYGGAGGGGWYGGSGTVPDSSGDDDRGGGGGSGFVWTSSTASSVPSGYSVSSSYYLTDATTYAGNTSFASTSGSTETGHSGAGYARITLVSGTKKTEITETTNRWNNIEDQKASGTFTGSFNYNGKIITETDTKGNKITHKEHVGLNYVEYIESTGTQWIDTGITSSNNTRIEMELAFTENSSTYGIMGSRISTSAEAYNMFLISGDIRWDYYKSRTATSGSYTVNNKVTIKQTDTQTTFTIGETTKTLSNSSTTFSVPYNIYLFSVNTAGEADNRCAKMKLYSCKIYNGTTLARNFIPAIDQNNVPCLYDKISKKYFYNSGTGNFNYQ